MVARVDLVVRAGPDLADLAVQEECRRSRTRRMTLCSCAACKLRMRRGLVEFKTIYPGHYPGRVNHIHMKVHVGGGATKPAAADAAHPGVEVYAGGHVAHTGQLFFPEDVSRFVEATHPYSSQKVRRTTLDEDMVFNGQGGAGSVAQMTPVTSTQLSDGYVATLVVAVDPEATPELVGIGGRPPSRDSFELSAMMAEARASWGAACCARTQTAVRAVESSEPALTLWTHAKGYTPYVF